MYNSRSRRNGGLELALRGMVQGQVDCGVIQETKLTNGVYMQNSSEFQVIAMAAPSDHHGIIAVL